MADQDLRRIESFQYPNAHLGHLTPSQQEALGAFKLLCTKEGYYTPAGEDGKPDASHDDETMLRYLRARKFVPRDAFGQFKDTEDWRKENHLDDLYEQIDIHEYEATRRLYPQWTGRVDKRGIPVYVYEVAHLNSKTISNYDDTVAKKPVPVKYDSSKINPKLVRLFALYENLTRFILPLCSVVKDRPHQETPISQSNNIVDISRVGLKQFWNLKSHMQDASTLATAHYPETLDRIFIIGAPAFFPTVWGWIKRWFDPITVSKIFILSQSNVKSTLEKYIEPANIPKKYGGELEFEFGSLPVPEPAIQDSIIWENPTIVNGIKTFPIGPVQWVEKNGEVQAIAIGTENGQSRRVVVARLPNGTSIRAALNGKSGVPNTPVDEAQLSYLGTGTDTQPVDEGTEQDEVPPSSSETPTPEDASISKIDQTTTTEPNDPDIAVATSAIATTSLQEDAAQPSLKEEKLKQYEEKS